MVFQPDTHGSDTDGGLDRQQKKKKALEAGEISPETGLITAVGATAFATAERFSRPLR